MILLLGGILGAIAVILGAYTEHSLGLELGEKMLHSLNTAIFYNQIHSVVIIAIGLSLKNIQSKLLSISGIIFILGTTLFCFSIYAFVIFHIPNITKLTPIGGLTLILGWIVLGGVGIFHKNLKKE